ncbi:MAG: hypothetical protein J7K73_03745 [Nanoarchaeota archaeon]|nr:hypothetical protein [Nanoarchaeota archaeon]
MGVGGKGQGLPMHVIIVIVLGIVILTLILLYVFGVFGEGGTHSIKFFNISKNVANNSSETVKEYFGT